MNTKRPLSTFSAPALFLAVCAAVLGPVTPLAADNAPLPPGVIINHSPPSTGLYIGSPSLAILSEGHYLASHDFFGPNSLEHECPTVALFRSTDRGQTWQPVTRLRCLFWNGLFTHRGAVYLMGAVKHHGRIVIRRSRDAGLTWSEPRDAQTGLLAEGQYHTAPVPVIEHAGRLWRAFENASGGAKWGERYQAGMLSIPVGADLLVASNWTFSNFLPRNAEWLGGRFGGWLEGNAVVSPQGRVLNLLRVDTPAPPEKAALVEISADGRTASFDPDSGFIDFPGGAKKFTIRKDPQGDFYWTVATIISGDAATMAGLGTNRKPAGVRNSLTLLRSADLRHWEIRCRLLHHPDVARHGFQYVDWQFEGPDLIAACRTAFDDAEGGAHNNHDANFLTFHRWTNFRTLKNDLQ
jgi:hypothetical protein